MKITDGLRGGAPRFSFEFFPPKTELGAKTLYETISHLHPVNPLYVSVTYGAGGSTRDFTVELAHNIKHHIGIESMAHIALADHKREDLVDLLDKLRDDGIDNLVALRGDAPKGVPQSDVKQSGFKYASDFIGFIKSNYDFCVAGACYPEGHPESPSLDADIENLKRKVDAGTDFLITQLFFDAEVYFRFVERIQKAGIHIPVIPGLMPVTTISQLERFTTMCGTGIPKVLRERLEKYKDSPSAVTEVGILWSTAQAMWLLNGGAPGVHFYTLNRSHSTRIICERLRFVLNLSQYF
jgi:methylenetetrahydrofolate reductase (NADPH)